MYLYIGFYKVQNQLPVISHGLNIIYERSHIFKFFYIGGVG